jgi:hypothetical protein
MRLTGSVPLSSGIKRSLFLELGLRRLATAARLFVFVFPATAAFASQEPLLRGAPSFSLFGAFFPAWMFCALIGIIGAIAARAAMLSSGLARILPFQLFVCASIGLIVGLLVWLIWFGQ